LECLTHQLADLFFVLDEQDGLGPRKGPLRRVFGFICGGSLLDRREVDLYASAMTGFAVDNDLATALLDDAVNRGEAQSCALPLSFGGEEGLKNMTSRLSVHPDPGVGHGQHCV